MTVEDHRLHAVSDQQVSAGQSRRPGTDNGHLFPAIDNPGEIRSPALCQRLVGDIALDVANRHRALFIAQRTGPFTQAILRANPAGYLRQAVGLMGQRHGGVDIPRLYPLNPLGNMVMQRAGPFTDTVFAALQAALRGLLRLPGVKGQNDLGKIPLADRRGPFIGLAARRRCRHLAGFCVSCR